MFRSVKYSLPASYELIMMAQAGAILNTLGTKPVHYVSTAIPPTPPPQQLTNEESAHTVPCIEIASNKHKAVPRG